MAALQYSGCRADSGSLLGSPQRGAPDRKNTAGDFHISSITLCSFENSPRSSSLSSVLPRLSLTILPCCSATQPSFHLPALPLQPQWPPQQQLARSARRAGAPSRGGGHCPPPARQPGAAHVQHSAASAALASVSCASEAQARRPLTCARAGFEKKYTEQHEWVELSADGKTGESGPVSACA